MDELLSLPPTIPGVIIAVAVAVSMVLSAIRKRHPEREVSAATLTDKLAHAEEGDREVLILLARLYQAFLGYSARHGGTDSLTEDERWVLRDARHTLTK